MTGYDLRNVAVCGSASWRSPCPLKVGDRLLVLNREIHALISIRLVDTLEAFAIVARAGTPVGTIATAPTAVATRSARDVGCFARAARGGAITVARALEHHRRAVRSNAMLKPPERVRRLVDVL